VAFISVLANNFTVGLMVMFAGSAPGIRHAYLFPISLNSTRYLSWLKTVPYQGERPLPNGSIHLGWADLLILALLLIPAAFLDPSKYDVPIIIIAVILLPILMFSIIYARLAINLGPAWAGYTILIMLVVFLHCLFTAIRGVLVDPGSGWILSLSVGTAILLGAFLLANYTLKNIMIHYPWKGVEDPLHGTFDGQHWRKYVYAPGNLLELGEPYTSLDPTGTYCCELRTIHRIGISLFIAAICSLISQIATAGGAFFILCIPAILVRGFIYFSNKEFATLSNFGRIFDDIKERNFAGNPMFSLFLLACLWALGGFILKQWAFTPLATAFELLFWWAAFYLPPSRRRWETEGKWTLRSRPLNLLRGDQRRAFAIERGSNCVRNQRI